MNAVYPASIREQESVLVVRWLTHRTVADGDPHGGTLGASIPYRTAGQSAGEAATGSLEVWLSHGSPRVEKRQQFSDEIGQRQDSVLVQ